jgi:hypothetical protein
VKLALIRYAYLASATLGFLYVPGIDVPHFATIEEPWHPNPAGPGGSRLDVERIASCVPDGEYRLVPHSSPKHPDVWALLNPALGVYHMPGEIPPGQKWGRSAVLIHVANTTKDIEGCIGVGLRVDTVSPGVFESSAAIADLRRVLARDEHQLTIRPTRGTTEPT